MIVRNFLSIMFFCAFAISAMAQDIEWKTIDTEINSFEVPSDWRNSFHEEPGNVYKKMKIEKKGISDWMIAWCKIQSSQNFSWDDFQEVKVSVMSRLDGQKLSWKTMRKLRGTPEQPATKQLFEKENEICYKCVYDAKDMNGKSRSWTNIIYYREENNQVHRMEISTTTRNYKKIEGLEAAYMHMIKSLKVKEFDM